MHWEMLAMKIERFCPQIDFLLCYTAVSHFVSYGEGKV